MKAFFVSRIRVKDAEKLQDYAKAAGPTLAAHGGELAVRGSMAKALLGEADDHHVTSVVTFPDLAAVEAWFTSPDYTQHAALRDAAGDMQFVAYEIPTA